MNAYQKRKIVGNIHHLLSRTMITRKFLKIFKAPLFTPEEMASMMSATDEDTSPLANVFKFFIFILDYPNSNAYEMLLAALKETKQVVPYEILSAGSEDEDYVWRPTPEQLFKLPVDSPDQFHMLLTYLIDIGSGDLLKSEDVRKATLLQVAIGRMEVKKESILLFQDFGVGLNTQDFCKRNALMYAIDGGRNKRYLEMLVGLGADYNIVDVEENNVLHYAARKYNGAAINFFLNLGVPTGANSDGETPLRIAVKGIDIENAENLNAVKSLLKIRCQAPSVEYTPGSPFLYYAYNDSI